MDALRYFGLYRFAFCMDPGHVRIALMIYRCSEVDYRETDLEDGFVSYDFEERKMFDLEAGLCQLVNVLVAPAQH